MQDTLTNMEEAENAVDLRAATIYLAGEGSGREDATLHGRECGRRTCLCFIYRCFSPNPPNHHSPPPKGGRHRAGADTPTQRGGRPTEAQRGKGGLAEGPTAPRVV